MSKKNHKNTVPEAHEDEDVTIDLEENEAIGEDESEPNLEDAYEALNNRYLRVCADYDNFRRRARQSRQANYDEGVIDTVRALMPVVDSIDAAMQAADQSETDEASEFAEGLALIRQQLDEAFQRMGVVEIEGEGADFDPNVHQAVLHEEDDEHPDNHVVQVFQKGYKKGDRVIRHAMVKVVN